MIKKFIKWFIKPNIQILLNIFVIINFIFFAINSFINGNIFSGILDILLIVINIINIISEYYIIRNGEK